MLKQMRIRCSIFSAIFVVLLFLGLIVSISVYHCRIEREEYYQSGGDSKYADFMYAEKNYYICLWSDEEMTLLEHAADKNALYYEIAADYVRHWKVGEIKDYIDRVWLPYDLSQEDYLNEVAPLLEDVYIPVLPETHEKMFDYDLITIYRQENESASVSAMSEQIRVRCLLKDRTSGHEDYACEISILVDPQYRINRGAEGNRDELYTTLTTSDGYDINYYVNEHSPTPEPGSCWGEVYVADGQPLYFSIATWRGETLIEYGLPTYLSDSTLISYAEHLETDETLRTEVSKQWNTISLIYYGIILYGILVLAMGAATVVFAMRWRKKKKCERQLANHV